MRSPTLRLAASVGLASLCLAAMAQVTTTSRTSLYGIVTGNQAFNGAFDIYSIDFTAQATKQGDSISGPLFLKNLHTNPVILTTGGLVETYNSATGTEVTSFPTSNLKGSGSITYASPAATNFNDSFLVKGVTNGFHTLEFQGGGFGFDSDGFPFTLDVKLLGNWTKSGTSKGDIQILGYDHAWSAPTPTYHNGVTEIKMFNSSYNATTDPNPNLDFKLYGSAAPVPSPAAFLVYGFGLVGLGFVRKARKA